VQKELGRARDGAVAVCPVGVQCHLCGVCPRCRRGRFYDWTPQLHLRRVHERPPVTLTGTPYMDPADWRLLLGHWPGNLR
jgi:hypothetical protein